MQPKYKVGDWLSAEDRIFSEVVAYIKGAEPIYALEMSINSGKDGEGGTRICWFTEFEVDEKFGAKVKPSTGPNYARYAKLEAGDVLHVGDTGDIYTTVLAKVGKLVLLSDIPHSHDVKTIHKLADQIKELTDGEVDIEETLDTEMKELKNHGSARYARRVANMWKSTDWIARMNWPIVEE